MAKKPKYEWFRRGWDERSPIICENGDAVLSVYTYGDRPLLVVKLRVAYLDMPKETIWRNGRKVGELGPGWRYRLSAYCGGGWRMLHIVGDDGSILADSPTYPTRQEAIKAAMYELVEACDKKLLIPGDSSKPYNTQYGLISRPGGEQLAFYLCMPEMEPVWQLLEEVTRHDDWLAEIRAPKKSEFVEQLILF